MLEVINSKESEYSKFISDDPVRPEIPWEFRVGQYSEIFVLRDYESVLAIVCCAYRDNVPVDVEQLYQLPQVEPHVAVFYTIWSYRSGSGAPLIISARDWIRANRSNIRLFMTLSPQTEMARRFHLRNGADVFRVNSDTVNYQYL